MLPTDTEVTTAIEGREGKSGGMMTVASSEQLPLKTVCQKHNRRAVVNVREPDNDHLEADACASARCDKTQRLRDEVVEVLVQLQGV